ncbi:phosphoenolpyruvate carboxykinase (ATP) [Devosia sp. XJ19-1]|uniref:Phosphoenolpyruvate carboxykinase (ATP) n=1 Tax=Devosia ureilytica TaxID=2952754 RepID=A0A9Q4FRJ9_9HYPH|nr:phosphoenolpyruvate carboxykinase (ATP) [Devosia ureilytica]MCP8883335.1 phosphoenolpyruvate carboxykinase (ATP) [Devosia ureilytica]MCP8886297.1 phosphoenolpyruvate carboxykinase (ATP) [Devosia ureilytica]
MPAFDHQGLRAKIAGAAVSLSDNAIAPALVAAAIGQGGATLTAHGALSVETGAFTGRSPKDKFIVRDGLTADRVWWDNSGAMAPAQFDVLLNDIERHLAGQALFRQDLLAGADPDNQYDVTVLTPSAWHALFIRNLLIRRDDGIAISDRAMPVTIVHAPLFQADPARHGCRSETVIALDMSRNLVVIAGTRYAGEIKKSVFSLFNFHAPDQDVLPMHCSANLGPEGEAALFFGLSGTGKTTLSNDPNRPLIGDDEHGWSAKGVFNLEGGCYAKTVNLSAKAEPEIHAATRRFGTVLENVVLDAGNVPMFEDVSLTENTRAAYPIHVLPSIAKGSVGGTPKTVVFLTADAFGVLPPLARLSPDQAVYHFLSGYTAKVAGTERGVTEPQATFSACFGAPFMPLHPTVYGAMLAQRLEQSGAQAWLLNTGWIGGAYGTGKRIDIASTRRLLSAALDGELDGVDMRFDPLFGFEVPMSVPGVDERLLDPRQCWADGDAYDVQATKLVALFRKNFEKFGPEANADAGPKLQMAAE